MTNDVGMTDGARGMDAFFQDRRRTLQFGLRRLQGASANGRQKSSQRRIVAFQITPTGIAVLAGQGLMNIGELNLPGELSGILNGQPGQMRTHSFDDCEVFLPALFENGFCLFSKKFEIERPGHSTTSVCPCPHGGSEGS